MNETDVTREGLEHVRPRHASRGEQPMVPDAEFGSYYGQPIINQPVWRGPDIAGYFFLGGLGGAASVMAAGAHLSGRGELARALKIGGAVAGALSTVALIHDLGRRARFVNMLRTFKPTSPMSVGSWVLAAYAPAATVAAASDLTGIAPGIGTLATTGAAALGPILATYTAALVSNTAVPAWHDAYREMPFVFASSAVTSAAGLALVAAPLEECGPARFLGVLGAAAELGTERVMEERMGLAREAFYEDKASTYQRAARGLLGVGIVGSLAGRRSRLAGALSGAALLAGSAFTRFAIFEAGLASAADPKYTVVPQRQRLEARGGRSTSAVTNGHAPADAVPSEPPPT